MVSRNFWIVAGLLLVWSLIGDAAYLAQVTADLGELAKTDPDTARAFATMPEWAWSAYAIAVWVATLGGIALLMRRRMAVPLYAVSLAAVLVQFGWSFFGSCDHSRQGRKRGGIPAADHRDRRLFAVVCLYARHSRKCSAKARRAPGGWRTTWRRWRCARPACRRRRGRRCRPRPCRALRSCAGLSTAAIESRPGLVIGPLGRPTIV